MRRLIFSTIALSLCIMAAANTYKSSAVINPVPSDGYYKILLSPQIIASMQSGYGDVRIMDETNKEVPYLLFEEPVAKQTSFFKSFDLEENKYVAEQKLTRIVVSNPTKEILTSFLLLVRNSGACKDYILKGSDNKTNWFIINRGSLEQESSVSGDTAELRQINFPKSNYRFLEITIKDKKHDPIQVIKIGQYDYEKANGLFSEIVPMGITRKDSLKKTILTLTFEQTYELFKLRFDVASPELYYRNVCVGRYTVVKKRKNWEEYGEFSLSSKGWPELEFEKVKTSEINIIIENNDNAPLQISAIKGYMQNKYLIAKLEKAKKYMLHFGCADASTPDYDLKYFEEVIPKNTPVVNTSLPQISAENPEKVSPQFFNKTILWIVISVVILILGVLCIKILLDMNKKV